MNNILRNVIMIVFRVVGALFILLGLVLDFNFILMGIGLISIWVTISFNKTSKQLVEQEKENKLRRNIKTYVAGATYNQDIIEEMYWDDNLPVTLTATLENDLNNKYNKNAVKVMIQGKSVGFLADKELPKYREFQEKYDYIGTFADIVQKGEGEFGIYYIDLNIIFREK